MILHEHCGPCSVSKVWVSYTSLSVFSCLVYNYTELLIFVVKLYLSYFFSFFLSWIWRIWQQWDRFLFLGVLVCFFIFDLHAKLWVHYNDQFWGHLVGLESGVSNFTVVIFLHTVNMLNVNICRKFWHTVIHNTFSNVDHILRSHQC